MVIDGELFYEAHWGHQLSQRQKSHGLHLALADDMRRWKTAALAEAMCHGFNIAPGLMSGDDGDLKSRTHFVYLWVDKTEPLSPVFLCTLQFSLLTLLSRNLWYIPYLSIFTFQGYYNFIKLSILAIQMN